MPNSYPRDGILNQHLTTIKDSYISIIMWYRKEMSHYRDVLQTTTVQWTSTEVNVYIRRHQTRAYAHITLITYLVL